RAAGALRLRAHERAAAFAARGGSLTRKRPEGRFPVSLGRTPVRPWEVLPAASPDSADERRMPRGRPFVITRPGAFPGEPAGELRVRRTSPLFDDRQLLLGLDERVGAVRPAVARGDPSDEPL